MWSQIVTSYFFLEVVEASRPPQLGFAIYIKLHLAQFLVALVAQFGVALGGDEEFFGLLGEGLHQRVVADLAQGLCELAVLDVGLLVNEVVLVGDALLGVVPVGGLVELALEGFHHEGFVALHTYLMIIIP